jgi:hypothetical protein
MPLDSLEFSHNPMLARLAGVEGLLAIEHQWCKGRLRHSEGRLCLVGAIEPAGCCPETARIILRAAREVSGKRYWRIESFNDDPRTTHADVLAVLRRARQNIIAGMAGECDPQPWHRKWLQALRHRFPGPEPAEQSQYHPVPSPRPTGPAGTIKVKFGGSERKLDAFAGFRSRSRPNLAVAGSAVSLGPPARFRRRAAVWRPVRREAALRTEA